MLLFNSITPTFIWVDVVVLVVLLIGLVLGLKKGFIDQLFSLLGIVVVVALALFLCKPVANSLMASDKGVIFDKVSNFLSEKLGSWEYYTTTQVVWSDVETNKTLIATALEMLGLPSFLVSFGIFNSIFKGFSTQATTLDAQLPQQITIYINYAVAFLILFVVLFVTIWIVKRILRKIVELPLLKQLNQFLGMLFGLIKNFVIVIAVFMVITFISSFITPLGNFINDTVYEMSWIGHNVIRPIVETLMRLIVK